MLTFLKNIPLTFYSTAFYKNLALNGKGWGIHFLLLVTLLNIAGFGPSLYEGSSKIMDEQKILLSTLPDLEIKNGILSIEGDQKQSFTFLQDAETGPYQIILDINASTPSKNDLAKKMQDERIMLWANKENLFYFNAEESKIEQQPLSEYEDIKITHTNWVQASEMIANIIWPMTLVTYIIMIFIAHLALTFLGGLFLWLIAPLFKRKTDMQAATRLAASAKVPLAFIFLIITPQQLLQILFWFGFAMFAILSLPQEKIEKG